MGDLLSRKNFVLGKKEYLAVQQIISNSKNSKLSLLKLMRIDKYVTTFQ